MTGLTVVTRLTSDIAAGDQFGREQFELQLELEDLTRAQLRQRGHDCRRRCDEQDISRQRRIDLALQVLLAFNQMPGVGPFEAEERFAAWCEGFGLAVDDVYRDLKQVLRRRAER